MYATSTIAKASRHLRRVAAAVVLACATLVVHGGVAPAVGWADVPASEIVVDETPAFRFHFPQRYRPAVERMEAMAPATLDKARAALGLEDFPRVEVWVLPEVDDYFELKDVPSRAPEWAAGLSLSDRHTIIVANASGQPPEEVFRTFAHELAHVAVDHARAGQPVPRWFHEGFATWLADEWTAQRSSQLAQAASGGGLKPFSELTRGFPPHSASASLAYDQSFHFLRWLMHEYGDGMLVRVMDQVRQGAPFETAVGEVTGKSFARLEAEWRAAMVDSTTFWSVLSDEYTIFFGAAVLFLIAFVVKSRRKRKRLRTMEDDDPGEWDYDESRYPLPGMSDRQ